MIRIALIFGACLAFAGCQSESKPQEREVKPIIVRFFLESPPNEEGTMLQLPVSRVALKVDAKPVLTEYDITTVNLARLNVGWCLVFQLTPAARRISTGCPWRCRAGGLSLRSTGSQRGRFAWTRWSATGTCRFSPR